MVSRTMGRSGRRSNGQGISKVKGLGRSDTRRNGQITHRNRAKRLWKVGNGKRDEKRKIRANRKVREGSRIENNKWAGGGYMAKERLE